MSIPHVLLAFHSRPMSAGIMFREGFRQAGCRVTVAGPGTPTAYGKPDGSEHTFDDADYVPPHIFAENAPLDVGALVAWCKDQPCGAPDLVVMIDQLDPYCLQGQSPVPFVYVTVENWQPLYAERYAQARVDRWFYMIRHLKDGDTPFPEGMTWLPFGFDPNMHPYLPEVPRTRWVIQIGSPYDPRPAVWNHLRQDLDGAPPVSPNEYRVGAYVTPRTIFGRIPSYRGMAIAHNQCLAALSSSNVDFSPMRTFEAYGMGCVLISDDVPAIRALLGAPLQEDTRGIWVAHDRSGNGYTRAVGLAKEAYEEMIVRGMALAYQRHTYRHRAQQILASVGMKGALRVV